MHTSKEGLTWRACGAAIIVTMVARLSLLVVLWLTLASPVRGDSFAPIAQRIFTPARSGTVFFTMVPPGPSGLPNREGFGAAYQLQRDGTFKLLYRTKGWHANNVYVSPTGQYLVRMGPWNFGDRPKKADLAVAFYSNGELLKSYSTFDLVKDPEKVLRTKSHYFWRADENYVAQGKPRQPGPGPHLDSDNRFRLHTIDGWSYAFDITTGHIVAHGRTAGFDEEAQLYHVARRVHSASLPDDMSIAGGE